MSSEGTTSGQVLAFAEALERLSAAAHVLGRASGIPKYLDVTKAVQRIGATHAAENVPDSALLEKARKTIVEASRAGRLSSVPRSLLRQAPWLLWTPTDPLVTLPGLMDAVFNLARRSVAVVRNLIEAWLEACGRSVPGLKEAGVQLRKIILESSDARLERWKQGYHSSVNLFDGEDGPKAVALAILEWSEPVEDIIAGFGLNTPLRAVGGYARLVQQELLLELTERLTQRDALTYLDRAMAFTIVDGTLRFGEPAFRGYLADALLEPWQASKPSADVVTSRIQKILLQFLGDPRTKSANWHEASAHSRDVMRAWLSRASLLTFFDVISDHADKDFIYRRSFWTAYLTAGVIEGAWIALGYDVFAAAKTIKELDGEYASFSGSSAKKSAILFQIGGYIFCEFSHAGALRAWPANSTAAPHLYRERYQREDLMKQCLKFPGDAGYGLDNVCNSGGLWHVAGAKGYWQKEAARFIADKCKIYLGPKDWMPK